MTSPTAQPTRLPTPLPTRAHHAFWPKRVPRQLVVPETSLWFNLEVAARRWPNRPAYVFFGRELTYRQLFDQADEPVHVVVGNAKAKPVIEKHLCSLYFRVRNERLAKENAVAPLVRLRLSIDRYSRIVVSQYDVRNVIQRERFIGR